MLIVVASWLLPACCCRCDSLKSSRYSILLAELASSFGKLDLSDSNSGSQNHLICYSFTLLSCMWHFCVETVTFSHFSDVSWAGIPFVMSSTTTCVVAMQLRNLIASMAALRDLTFFSCECRVSANTATHIIASIC